MAVEAAHQRQGRSGTGIIVLRLARGFEVGGKGGGIAAKARVDGRSDGGGTGAQGFRGQAALDAREIRQRRRSAAAMATLLAPALA